ncbi:MAG: T9SS type A sorting domain-containing protein, partial [Bacteroidales bacterium]|nr:T9SS type A sorting domain-containing protein [Bacteroidales bacterium]
NGNYGGILGSNEEGTGSITNSFWDKTTSGLSLGCGYSSGMTFDATGKTTAELKNEITFTSAGWDFVGETVNGLEDIWKITTNLNNGYPCFFWQVNTVGINDIERNIAFNIYPNPAWNEVVISLINNDNQPICLSVYNIMGREVKTEIIKQESSSINVSDLDSGIYFFMLRTKDWTKSQKLIIQR